MRKGETQLPAINSFEVLSSLQNHSLPCNVQVYQENESWIRLPHHAVLGPLIEESLRNAQNEKNHPKSSIFMHWYVADGACKYGPFSLVQMVEYMQQRRVGYGDLVYHPNYFVWKRLSEMPPFADANVKALFDFADLSPAFTQRKYPRVKYDNSVLIFDNNAFYSGYAWSLSRKGLGVVVNKQTPFQLEDNLNIHIQSNDEHGAVKAKARVVSRHVKGGLEKFGLMFEQEIEALSEYIDRLIP